jgi:transmembrane sensor
MTIKSAPQELDELQRMNMAAEWVLLLRQEQIRDEDIANWLQWCEADPRNQHAFDRAQKLLNLTRALRAQDLQDDMAARPPLAESDRPARRAPSTRGLRRAPGARSAWLSHPALRFGLAIAATALIVSGAWTWYTGMPVAAQAVVFSPEPVHASLLPDGSRMELAEKTEVAVNYTAQQRTLEMQNGAAYFTVVPNKQRPFVVAAGPVRVRAVGTAFNVRRAGDRVVVTVTKGSVAVSRADGNVAMPDHPVQVAAGGQLVWDKGQQGAAVTAVDPAVALAWREGRLEYAGEPLGAVIADINRYSSRPVSIADESVKKLRFTGTVMTDSTEEWLRALPGNFPVRLVERGNALILEASSQAGASDMFAPDDDCRFIRLHRLGCATRGLFSDLTNGDWGYARILDSMSAICRALGDCGAAGRRGEFRRPR